LANLGIWLSRRIPSNVDVYLGIQFHFTGKVCGKAGQAGTQWAFEYFPATCRDDDENSTVFL
jgi:hypothetical protein